MYAKLVIKVLLLSPAENINSINDKTNDSTQNLHFVSVLIEMHCIIN